MNRLFYGDNLHVMRDLMGNHAVDLIYLDPPFKSNRTYNLLYARRIGRPIPEQEEAFCDTWTLGPDQRQLAKAMPVFMREHGVDEYYVRFWKFWMEALIHTQPRLLAYLVYMVQRMMYMKLILKPTGSIFLHCDPEASHYIKVMMDAIFGHGNFRNEIIWSYNRFSRRGDHEFPSMHDVILFYGAGKGNKFHKLKTEARDTKRYEQGHHTVVDRGVKKLLVYDADKAAAKIEQAEEEGTPIQYTEARQPYLGSVWSDIPIINPNAKERLGYQTQKPIDLVRRIINASTDPEDVVFDPFCGCGTSVYAAHETGRQWIGCDVAILAVRLIEDQLDIWYNLKRDADYTTTGIPNSVESAERLFRQDPFQFEHWIVERVGGFPTKKTGDRGVDGVMYYDLDDGEMGKMIFSVKGGNIRPSDVRDLEGTRSVDDLAHLAGFISLKEPTKAMRQAAADAGKWQYKGDSYDKVQMLTVKEIVEDNRLFRTPTRIQYRDDHLQQSFGF